MNEYIVYGYMQKAAMPVLYRLPSNPGNLTPAGTPKTFPNAANQAARRKLTGQDMSTGDYGMPDITEGTLAGEIAGGIGALGKRTVTPAIQAGEEAAQRQREGFKSDVTGMMNTAEERINAKLKQLQQMPGQMMKRYGGSLLAGGGSLIGLLALMMAMNRRSPQQMPQQQAYMNQMRPMLNQQMIYR